MRRRMVRWECREGEEAAYRSTPRGAMGSYPTSAVRGRLGPMVDRCPATETGMTFICLSRCVPFRAIFWLPQEMVCSVWCGGRHPDCGDRGEFCSQ